MQETCEEYRGAVEALIEGTLGTQALTRLRAHVSACASCRKEHAQLLTMIAGLEAFGAAAEQAAPQIDIVDAVMEAVARVDRPVSRKVRALRAGPVWPRFVGWAGLAAAAGLVLAFWFAIGHVPEGPGPVAVTPIAKTAPQIPKTPPPEAVEPALPVESAPAQTDQDKLEEALAQLAEIPGLPVQSREDMGSVAALDIASLTVEDVLAIRAEASTNDAARAQLVRWASLTPERAEEIIDQTEPVSDASIGVSLALSPEEARANILDAIRERVDEAYLRLAALETYYTEGVWNEEAEAQAVALKDLDPNNAISYYFEALSLLDGGDPEAAVLMFAEAQGLDIASLHPLDAANYHVEALIENGLDAQTARLLTALTAGTAEYNLLMRLGGDLTEHAQQYLANGDTATARQILLAAQRLGMQIDAGALFAQERLAGLDVQRLAIGGLNEVYQVAGEPEGTTALVNNVLELMGNLEDVGDYFLQLDSLFSGGFDLSTLEDILNGILLLGDLRIFELLPL